MLEFVEDCCFTFSSDGHCFGSIGFRSLVEIFEKLDFQRLEYCAGCQSGCESPGWHRREAYFLKDGRKQDSLIELVWTISVGSGDNTRHIRNGELDKRKRVKVLLGTGSNLVRIIWVRK